MRFALERWVVRGLGHRLLLAAAIVLAVALVAGALVALLDAGSSDLGENVWWAFLRLTDPGYLGDDEGIARRGVSTVVTVLGYVLFLGLLIAILSQWMNQLIARLESGITPVALADHVLILGWTQRTPTIVTELLSTGSRVQRFLATRGGGELRIVILAERVDEALLRELRERVGERWNDRQVFLRAGTPLRIDHLERVAFLNAAVLILPGADFAEQRPEAVDAQTVKTLMAVSEHARSRGSAPPLAVAELCDGRRARVAHDAYAGESEILAADDIISRLIAQSVQQRGLCAVFRELLTLNVGNALHVRKLDGQAGRSFGELRGACSRAIAIGTVRPGSLRPALNPPPDTLLDEDDRLVFVARSFEDCEADATPKPGAPAARVAPRVRDAQSRRVLILGFSRKVPALLEEFARYVEDDFEVDVVSATPAAQREAALARHGADLTRLRLRHVEAGYSAPGVLEDLEPARYRNIILLASERLDEEGQADATTVFAYLQLRRLLEGTDPRPRLFVELLDEQNEFLFEREDEDEIVSPLLVSYLLSQVALRRELASVVAELSRSSGAQIVLQSAVDYLDGKDRVRFGDLESAAAARGEIALGLHGTGASGDALALNPDREIEWELGPRVEVVVLRTLAEPGARAERRGSHRPE